MTPPVSHTRSGGPEPSGYEETALEEPTPAAGGESGLILDELASAFGADPGWHY